MSKNLVIVESPAKAKTISKYLGKDFDVMASYGHVRDLVPKEGAVDPDNHFAMKYQVIERNEKHVKAIIRALRKADALYLATDPDREGEAISWHLIELLKERDALNSKDVHRVVFHEITKQASPACTRLSRGFQPVAATVEKSTAWIICWPSAKPGLENDRRARTRDRSIQGARILDD
jgi:DNA topoisomerase IA